MELHNTHMGRKLIEGDLPRAISALEKIAAALEKLNKPVKSATKINYNPKTTNTSWDG